ncbi:unnamed protein product [Cunninghamella echinulata]
MVPIFDTPYIERVPKRDTDNESTDDDEDMSDSASPPPSSNKQHSRPQALFLNFSSDLSPQKVNRKPKKSKRQAAYRVNGVNILNRNNLDSKTAIERIQRRRENHNHVERRRRDNINNTILELSQIIPNACQHGQKPNKGNILKLTLEYVKQLQLENESLKNKIPSSALASASTTPSPPFLSSTLSSSSSNSSLTSTPIDYHTHSAPTSPSKSFMPSHTPMPLSISVPNSPRDNDHDHSIHNNNYNNNLIDIPKFNYVNPPISAPQIPHYRIIQPTPSIPYHTVPTTTATTTTITTNTPTTSLRPLLPATNLQPQFTPSSSNLPHHYLPPFRMRGSEKLYSGACRY